MFLFQEAKHLLVEAYAQLRSRDGQANSKSIWRITVRQLESLVRLSEAMAKMECSDEVSLYRSRIKLIYREMFVSVH